MKKWAIFLLLVFAILGFVSTAFYIGRLFRGEIELGKRNDNLAVIQKIRELNRLESSQFTIETVISEGSEGNRFSEFLFGDKILLIAHGQVIAGFDLSKIKSDNVKVEGSNLTIEMPPAEILVVSLDSQKTKVYNRQTGFFTKGDKDLEGQARQTASEKIRAAACEEGILTKATQNAQKQLRVIFESMGFDKVTLIVPEGEC